MLMNQAGLLLLSVAPALTYPALLLAYNRRRKLKLADLQRLATSPKIKSSYAWAYGATSPEEVFRRTTSASAYIVPVALNMLTTTVFVAGFFYSSTDTGTVAAPLQALFARIAPVAVAGFAGSYLWSHYDLLRRFATFDLSPNALYLVWLRLVAGALAAPALSAALADNLRIPVAFAIGAFPLAWIQAALRAFARKRLEGSPDDQPCEAATLHCLQGATGPVIERLAEEGITSSQHVALADPLRLFLRTNLELTAILDLADQACLHLYVGEKLGALRAIGVRSAIEFAEVHDYLESKEPEELARGQELVALLTTTLGIDDSAVLKLVDSLYYDPQVSFIWELWGESFGTSRNEEDDEEAEAEEAPGAPLAA